MRTLPFFWKVFLAYATILVAGVLATTLFVSSHDQHHREQEVSDQLRQAAIMLREQVAGALPTEPTADLQQSVAALGQQLGLRFTVIAGTGRVLADSAQKDLAGVAAMENHLGRKESVSALRTGEGHARRTSPTLGESYYYYAVEIEPESEASGFARSALLAELVDSELTQFRGRLLRTSLLVGLVCVAAAYGLTVRLTRPIRTLAAAAQAITQGHYSQRVRVDTQDELETVARAVEQMSQELGFRDSQLRESVQRQATVLEAMAEGVLAVDSKQHVLFANLAAGKNLGFEPQQVAGRALLETVRSHQLRDLVQNALSGGLAVRGEIDWQTRKGRLIFDVQATPLGGSPPSGVVVLLHDITDIKRLEGMRQQFVANVSHELKTPLSSIKAYTETLLNGALEDDQHARLFLTRIDEQAGRLHELILDLLSIARIESGHATLELTSVLLPPVVEACMNHHQERARSGDLILEHEVCDANLQVWADEESLRQILDNLVDNAIKYTPAGGSVTVRCQADGLEARIEVADTGVGIAPEHHARLFERFYRVDKARSRELGGTGLGLAIVKHLCQSMRGSVSVTSTLGKGSTFTVRLPLAGASQEV
jgi:two-component system phosphate regulon sensor histidine kinase PhoR